ncbi:HlyD family type I secretion periplasmic adaptor subunit [Paraburkholderia humisilvae]|uniref:Membrane fusion protein (MFP) family protein n=1 Tax=Paraburkholderia humisilvae TaxID=627669 RepID=A0A6J5CY47_9BURK|nr:HlyD family type I secretion periplasmic adaptor subunit [Paraburkholderia humisilvae]CAB3746097.1 Hemolysin secretion protein D, chromosomal [Paraburkholderia humisilvae]
MARFQLYACISLLQRYAAVFRAAWADRAGLDSPKRLPHELAFQPAHLELVETPVHPAPLWAIRLIAALAVLALAVMIVGQLDIVATAKGKLVPNANVKIVQPALTGVVREISVKDGDRVAAGQLLMKLDTRQAAADAEKAAAARVDAALAAARARAILIGQQAGHEPVVESVEGASAERQRDAQRLADGVWHEYVDKLSSARAELAKRGAELDSTRAEIAKLVATAPLARESADHYRELSADRYVAQSDYYDKEQTALTQEHDLDGQRSHARELLAGIAEQHAEIESTVSQFRREQLDDLEKATQQLTQDRDDEAKAKTRQELLILTAPVSGTVQQLAVHTLGGVVTTAQSLMEIVPDDALEVDATIENKDVGFVSIGQRAAVKVETFPYTRYGMIEGTVIGLSNDAVQDKKLGLAFTARIRLASTRMKIDNRWISLTPGMAVTAEIKTGKRNVAEYFLGPLVESAQESMRER